MDKNFKLGLNHEKQWSSYLLGKELFVKRYHTVDGGNYPDGGCSFETYTNDSMIEVESLSELKTVKPGETVTHTESWALCKRPCDIDFKNDKSIDNMLEKL